MADVVEVMARAICIARGLDPETLFQTHGFPSDEPTDCMDSIGRTFSKCWRKSEPIARAALSALSDAGYVVVPVTPSEDMKAAGGMWTHQAYDGKWDVAVEDAGMCWDAMLSAAPAPK